MHPVLAGGIRGAVNASLGDAGASNDDASYTGDTGDSVLSMQYYIDKANQFQLVMNSLDAAATAAENMLAIAQEADLTGMGVGDPSIADDLVGYLNDFYDKRYQFRLTAEAINAGANTINAVGGRFPVLSIPSGLGIAPVVMGAVALGALATAAALIAWGNTWLKGLNARMATAASAAMIDDPDKKAAFLTQAATAQAAMEAADDSPITTIANIVKWGAIAGAVYLAFKAMQGD